MRRPSKFEKEYKIVCAEMKKLQGSLPQNETLYLRLASIKDTLEWAYPRLIKTKRVSRDRVENANARGLILMGYKHLVFGPTTALLHS